MSNWHVLFSGCLKTVKLQSVCSMTEPIRKGGIFQPQIRHCLLSLCLKPMRWRSWERGKPGLKRAKENKNFSERETLKTTTLCQSALCPFLPLFYAASLAVQHPLLCSILCCVQHPLPCSILCCRVAILRTALLALVSCICIVLFAMAMFASHMDKRKIQGISKWS